MYEFIYEFLNYRFKWFILNFLDQASNHWYIFMLLIIIQTQLLCQKLINVLKELKNMAQ